MPEVDIDLLVRGEFLRDRLSGSVLYNGRLYGHSAFTSDVCVFIPEHGWELLHVPSDETFARISAYRDAKLYRLSILDDSLPVFDADYFVASRGVMINYIGKIGYREASPELREAMMHGEDELRCFAIEALGRLGCTEYVPDMTQLLRNKSNGVKGDVVRALGALKDQRALVPLREQYEDTLRRMHVAQSHGKEWIEYNHEWSYFINVIESMLRIGGALAEQSLHEAMADPNDHIHNAAKRADFPGRTRRNKRNSFAFQA